MCGKLRCNDDAANFAIQKIHVFMMLAYQGNQLSNLYVNHKMITQLLLYWLWHKVFSYKKSHDISIHITYMSHEMPIALADPWYFINIWPRFAVRMGNRPTYVIMMVAAGLAPNRRQAISNHHAISSTIKEYHTGTWIISCKIQIALQPLNTMLERCVEVGNPLISFDISGFTFSGRSRSMMLLILLYACWWMHVIYQTIFFKVVSRELRKSHEKATIHCKIPWIVSIYLLYNWVWMAIYIRDHFCPIWQLHSSKITKMERMNCHIMNDLICLVFTNNGDPFMKRWVHLRLLNKTSDTPQHNLNPVRPRDILQVATPFYHFAQNPVV